jgi:hypothetical protein
MPRPPRVGDPGWGRYIDDLERECEIGPYGPDWPDALPRLPEPVYDMDKAMEVGREIHRVLAAEE